MHINDPTKKYPLVPLLLGSYATAQQKPNILWITIEDTSPQFIGCYGNKDARTPVIDKLASEGVRFNNAISCVTVSSASRSCLIQFQNDCTHKRIFLRDLISCQ